MSICVVLGCSPRDFLTRRLAADLISASESFKAPQTFWLATGVVSNKDFNSPESMVLQRRGWILGTQQNCPAGIEPAPCWDVVLSPLGVDTIRPLIANGSSSNGPIAIQVARRELVGITGISKAGNLRGRGVHLALGFTESGGRRALRQRSALPLNRGISRVRRRLAGGERERSQQPDNG